MNAPTLADSQLAEMFARAFQMSQGRQWGELWRNPENVLACLRRYITREEHNGKGWTVRRFAEACMADNYAPDGDELKAVLCLLEMGQGQAII